MKMKSIILYLLHNKIHLFFIALSSIIIIVSSTFLPDFLGNCFMYLEGLNPPAMHVDLVGLMIVYILRAVFKLLRNQLTFNIGNDIVYQLRMDYVDKMFQSNSNQRDKTKDFSILSR